MKTKICFPLFVLLAFACFLAPTVLALPDGFVYLADAVPDALQEIRYCSTYNFMGKHIEGYEKPVAIMTAQGAAALKKASDRVRKHGFRLKIFDAYRPQRAVNHFVRWTKDPSDALMRDIYYPVFDKSTLLARGFISAKSGHTRGSTVDLTLFDMKAGRDADMGGLFDYFGERSYADYTKDLTPEQLANRKLLREAMIEAGFAPIKEEWWHFGLTNEPFPDTYFDFPVR